MTDEERIAAIRAEADNVDVCWHPRALGHVRFLLEQIEVFRVALGMRDAAAIDLAAALERNAALEVKCDLLAASLRQADAQVGYLSETNRALLVECERLKGERDAGLNEALQWARAAERERDEAYRRLALITEPTPEVVERVRVAVAGAVVFRDVYRTAARAVLRALAEEVVE